MNSDERRQARLFEPTCCFASILFIKWCLFFLLFVWGLFGFTGGGVFVHISKPTNSIFSIGVSLVLFI
jgi:hypothetical protein